MRRAILLSAILSLCALVVGCPSSNTGESNSAASGQEWFADISRDVGLQFQLDSGPESLGYFLPRVTGSGGAALDFDGDGRLDLYLIHNGGPTGRKNQLFHQQPDRTFRDVSARSGLDVAGFGQGAAVGDVDNDGRPDLVLTEFGATKLFRNEGGGKFHDISRDAGIDNPLWGLSAAFLDFDRDGWLDLIVGNYLATEADVKREGGGKTDFPVPSAYPGTISRLYRNLGADKKGVRFADMTIKSGLGSARGKTMGIICADINGDRWPDIILANDMMANSVWINRKDGTFKDEALSRGLAYTAGGLSAANMGVAWGDVNGDTLPDLFITHFVDDTHTLWVQGPRGKFQDLTVAAGIAKGWRGTGFGTALVDFDCDGWLDLALVNGGVHRRVGSDPTEEFWEGFRQRHQLFQNVGQGKFSDISEVNRTLCERPAIGRSLIVADFDNDGAPDLVTTEIAGPARLLKNVAPKAGHWLAIRAVLAEAGGRDAYGAEIAVKLGDRTLSRLIYPGYSYCCSNDPRTHLGMGKSDRYDSIRVIWPNGSEELFPGGAGDREIVLRSGEGTLIKQADLR